MHIIFKDSSVFVPGNKVAVRGKYEAEEQLRRGESNLLRDRQEQQNILNVPTLCRVKVYADLCLFSSFASFSVL